MKIRCWILMALVLSVVVPVVAPATAVRAADGLVVGKVKDVDLQEKFLVVQDEKTGQMHTVVVGPHSEILLGQERKIPLSRVKPGAVVAVRDSMYAAQVKVGGEWIGTIRSIEGDQLVLTSETTGAMSRSRSTRTPRSSRFPASRPRTASRTSSPARVIVVRNGSTVAETVVVEHEPANILHEFWDNFRHNLFKPLLLFFYMGFLIPILRVKFEFPYVMYQALTIFLLIAIGWHGGEELARRWVPGSCPVPSGSWASAS